MANILLIVIFKTNNKLYTQFFHRYLTLLESSPFHLRLLRVYENNIYLTLKSNTINNC